MLAQVYPGIEGKGRQGEINDAAVFAGGIKCKCCGERKNSSGMPGWKTIQTTMGDTIYKVRIVVMDTRE